MMSNLTMDEIKTLMGKEEDRNQQVLHTMKTDADEAYKRLKIVRETHKDLGNRLNDLTRDMPLQTRYEYEQLFIWLERLEKSELENIRFGE